ncbi:MAG: phosphoenolpyruvate--protein phosphotransferase [Chromatiales bacterium]|nr:phosphoenolpyruvate--protein phosphotransferase [Chromatiales bacterium]
MTADASPASRRLKDIGAIVREVSAAPNLQSALRVVVSQTRSAMEVDVCTVYFANDEDHRHVIVATDGLSSRTVGKVQLSFGEGLIGRIAESKRLVNLDDIPPALDQDFLRQTGESEYRSLLGVPILYKGSLQGVLLVRQRTKRQFDFSDEALLTTLAAQLGGAIVHAKASGEWRFICRSFAAKHFDGVPGAPGVAIGRAIVVGTSVTEVPNRQVADKQAEELRLRAAILTVKEEISTLRTTLSGDLHASDLALFDAYELMLDSPELLTSALAGIHEGLWAPSSFANAVEYYATQFDEMGDPYLRERATDIRGLGSRIVNHLLGQFNERESGSSPIILVGQCLSALDIGQARTGNVAGLVSGEGSSLSHVAIVARALGIPAVVGLTGLPLFQLHGQELAIDGTQGRVHLQFGTTLRNLLQRCISEQRRVDETLEPLRDMPATTAADENVQLLVNAGFEEHPQADLVAGSSGIGLYRSELPFLLRDRLPSEHEQQELYRSVLQAAHPLPVTFRTLDIGGDKSLPYLSDGSEGPADHYRGVRFMIHHPEIFLTQLRAVFRASEGLDNLRLLFPMVSCADELDHALRLVDLARAQLLADGLSPPRCAMGVMIEVPAAVYQITPIAPLVEFFSVGTNDLSQFLLATERTDPLGDKLLRGLHPALLQVLHTIVQSVHRMGKPVSVCGEIAGDPVAALLLLGMGIDALSMESLALPKVKWALSRLTYQRMQSMADEALRCDRAVELTRLMCSIGNEIGLDAIAARTIESSS